MYINNPIHFIIIAMLLTIFIIVIILFLVLLKILTNQIDDLLNISYFLKQKIDDTLDEEYQASKYVSSIDNKLSSLSNRITTIVSEQNKINQDNQHRMPTPDEIKLINEAIRDQVLIEYTLSENQRIPRANFKEVVTNVCNTFPYIDPEYIVKKSAAIVEAWNK